MARAPRIAAGNARQLRRHSANADRHRYRRRRRWPRHTHHSPRRRGRPMMDAAPGTPTPIATALFARRRFFVAVFALITLLLAWPASHVRINAAFGRLLPQHHPYMVTYQAYSRAFGGGNQLLIALEAKHGVIFTPHFFDTLQIATDAIFFLPGIDRAQ